jgi:hypothetical protein
MEWVPAAGAETVSSAVPPLTAAVPIPVLPSRNCTLPVTVPGESVAVNVTACPYVAGLVEETSPTAEPALFTIWATAPDVAPV